MAPVNEHPTHISYIHSNPYILRVDEKSAAEKYFLIESPASTQKNGWSWNQQENQLRFSGVADVNNLYTALEFIFNSSPELATVHVLDPENQLDVLLQAGIAEHKDQSLQIRKEIFWQLPSLWLSSPTHPYPQKYAVANLNRHPIRPPQKTGVVYQRYIPWLKQTLSFRAVDIQKDLEYFHRWMNDARVAHFWEETGSEQQHRDYLEKAAADLHSQPIIACFDEKPFAYFEIYWAKEDRISPFYDSADYDRGWHLLVGEDAFRGRQWFSAWFPSLQHYLFLDDPRTQRIVAEPRHDNEKLIKHAQASGFANLKAFNFPHKRAQLLMLLRERFFEEYRWQPNKA